MADDELIIPGAEEAAADEETTVEVPLELLYLMQLVGEIAGSVAGADFAVSVQPTPDLEGVMVVMASREDPELGRAAMVRCVPGAQIRRMAIELCKLLYDAADAKHNPASQLVVPEHKLIIPGQQ